MQDRNFYLVARDDGRAAELSVIHTDRVGDFRVSIVEVGMTRDVDAMLAGRVQSWTPEESREVGIIFDFQRIIVSAGEPLQAHEVRALIRAGFQGVELFAEVRA